MKTKPTKVQKLIYSMLTENTGAHFLDSGGIYGRNHERNRKKTIKDFMNESEQSFSFDGSYIYRTVSVFHYLSGLELDPICDKFNKIQKKANNWDCEEDVYGVSSDAWDYLDKIGVEIEYTFNTYNNESDLSQILQGSRLRVFNDGQWETYYLIQIHGGCDARGGYTDAKLFKTQWHCEGIHEYLYEYMGQYELMEELEYIDSMVDYWDKEKVWTKEEIKEILTVKA